MHPIGLATEPKTARRAAEPSQPPAWSNWRALRFGLLGAVLLWVAIPPLNFWPLAWLAPVPWILLAERRELSGRRPYVQLWLAGFVFWLAAIHWLTLPHWATSFGLIALSFYLALYLPAFVALLRVAIHRCRMPAIVAAPLVYLGLELARDYLLTGFMLTGLGHSQYRWTTVIQVADLGGVHFVSALIVFVAAGIAALLPLVNRPRRLWPAAVAALSLAAALGYGSWRLSQQTTRPGPTVALIQGSIDITMKMDPELVNQIFDQYVGLTWQALEKAPQVDLIVWPETMFRYPWFTFSDEFQVPPDVPVTVEQVKEHSRGALKSVLGPFQRPILLGIDTVHDNGAAHYNSALLVASDLATGPRYDKVHRVMFGEYVPFADWFPWLYRLTPLPGGLTRGEGPVAVQVPSATVGDVCYAPNICFESTVSHLVRGQVNALAAQGREPDVLVNLTNDGWFWGSAELEQHLACEVFRAIECRKPFLVAANTGISAWIDSNGRVQTQGPKRATDVIIAHTQLDSRHSPYLSLGDWPAGIALACCLGLAVIGWRDRKQAAV